MELPTSQRRSAYQYKRILREISMEHTISTKELKAKLDRKKAIKVVETLAPERYREAHIAGALNISPCQNQGTCTAVVAQ
jgi:hypothetical protein